MNARRQLEGVLKTLLPKTWRIVPFQANLDNLDRIAVVVKQSTVKRLDAAPLSHRLHEFTVTVISPKTDPEQAEDQLDGALDTFLGAIESVNAGNGIAWSEVATNRSYADALYCFDVTLTTTFRKD